MAECAQAGEFDDVQLTDDLQPNEAGLGTHLSLNLAGNARFGPDVQYTDRIEYSVDASRGETFYKAIREYWPQLPDGALQPSFSGIRPKVRARECSLSRPREPPEQIESLY